MEIQEVEKNEKVYRNIDLRQIPYGNSETMVLLEDSPFENSGQYGMSYMFSFKYDGKTCTAFVPAYEKTNTFGVPFASKLSEFKAGDIIKITKNEGKSKSGKEFRYYHAEKTGEDMASVEQYRASKQQGQDDSGKPNMNPPQQSSPNLDLKPQGNSELSEWEQKILNGLKERNDLSSEQRIQIFVQNDVEYNRAKEIAEKNF